MFPPIPELPRRSFNTQYKCYSASNLPGIDPQDIEPSGKIIMPSSALDILLRLNTSYPMLFKLTNEKTERVTHCGVLKFLTDKESAYLPSWMMRNLLLQEGDILNIESVSLPVATYARFQPQSANFLDITDHKAVLENRLGSFACLTTGDILTIDYQTKIYNIYVLETKPARAVAIIEGDMNVEFAAPPIGYKEPDCMKPAGSKGENSLEQINLIPVQNSVFVPFQGEGHRLDGRNENKSADKEIAADEASADAKVRGIPDFSFKMGTLRFQRQIQSAAHIKEEEGQDEIVPCMTFKKPDCMKPAESKGENSLEQINLIPVQNSVFVPFQGEGHRLDGRNENKSADKEIAADEASADAKVRGIPDFSFKMGTLRFQRQIQSAAHIKEEEGEDEF